MKRRATANLGVCAVAIARVFRPGVFLPRFRGLFPETPGSHHVVRPIPMESLTNAVTHKTENLLRLSGRDARLPDLGRTLKLHSFDATQGFRVTTFCGFEVVGLSSCEGVRDHDEAARKIVQSRPGASGPTAAVQQSHQPLWIPIGEGRARQGCVPHAGAGPAQADSPGGPW